ncbi:MAG: hypothetical protein IKL38_00380 [Firmicutes bacterium]|nr:hypothetical protein [Bacillota bacterium]
MNLWAKLKDGDRTLKLVHDQLTYVSSTETKYAGMGGTYPNMLDAHPPFQIDGNFGVTSGIAQMFMQHENGKILILPALPSSFADGEIRGLHTKGNVTVSIRWIGGKAEKVTLVSPFTQVVQVQVNDQLIEVPLKADEVCTL